MSLLPGQERSRAVDSALDQLRECLDERRRHALELAAAARHEIPESHLLEVVLDALVTLAVGPGDERKHWPPGVPDDRNAALSEACDGGHRFIEPRQTALHAALRGRFGNDQWTPVACEILLAQIFDDAGGRVGHAHTQVALFALQHL